MKVIGDIIGRAVILICLVDRCSLEDSVVGNKEYSLEEREIERQSILAWISENDYSKFATQYEMSIFETPIKMKSNLKLLEEKMKYEAIEPLLWISGLIENLSDYEDYVTIDYGPVVDAGKKDHDNTRIVRKGYIRSTDEIEDRCKNAEIWFWRSKQWNQFPSSNGIVNRVGSDLGSDYEAILKNNGYDLFSVDLKIHGDYYYTIPPYEQKKLFMISKWRYYAFLWALDNNLRWEDNPYMLKKR